MGEKRKRQGQYLLSIPSLCLIYMVLAAGCRMMPIRPAALPDENAPEPIPVVALSETVESMDADLSKTVDCPLLDQAESDLENGDYIKALDAVDKAMADCGQGDSSIYRRALVIMVDATASMAPSKGVPDALTCFRGLESPMPDNGQAVRCWLDILKELSDLKAEVLRLKAADTFQKKRIKVLKNQLEQLKAVDLELGTPDADDASHE